MSIHSKFMLQHYMSIEYDKVQLNKLFTFSVKSKSNISIYSTCLDQNFSV